MITDISSAPEIFTLLTDEIHAEGEYLSFRINLIDIGAGSTTDVEGSENVLAQGSVALWVMIEDSCSILRQVPLLLNSENFYVGTRTAYFPIKVY
jgi:hypothetical protein